MNYKKIYDSLIKKRLEFPAIKTKENPYIEIHHIVPKFMGGTDNEDNLVHLSLREHYIAHILLMKHFEKLLEESKDKTFYIKSVFALSAMLFLWDDRNRLVKNKSVILKTNSRFYQNLRTTVNKQFVESGKKWFNSLSKDELIEHSNKISKSLRDLFDRGMLTSSFKGKKHSEETKKIIGEKSSINQKGEKNSSYGSFWIYNVDLKQTKRVYNNEIPDGWERGRISNWEFTERRCEICGSLLNLRKPCKKHICEECKEKEYQKQKIYYTEVNNFYKENGFEKTREKFNYPYSCANLVQQIKRYCR